MKVSHPKSIRRRLLTILYERYLQDPLDMLTPEDFLEDGALHREDLAANMHYLHDRNLVELMMGYNPPMFAAARITADGIDLVENRFEFNLRFPPEPGEEEEDMADLPRLMEQLTAEADFSPLDGEARASLLRDVQFLRDEVARPVHRWRMPVIETVLGWIAANFAHPDETLPSLPRIRETIARRDG